MRCPSDEELKNEKENSLYYDRNFDPLLPVDKDANPICKIPDEAKCAFTLIIMGGWWASQCMPLAVTALIPVVTFPLLTLSHAKLSEAAIYFKIKPNTEAYTCLENIDITVSNFVALCGDYKGYKGGQLSLKHWCQICIIVLLKQFLYF